MSRDVFARPWLRGVLVAFVAAAGIAACSSGDPVVTRPASSGSAAAALPAAIATGCVGPSTGTQTAALPAAGGVTGTVSVGPVTAPASGCALNVEVATGADATLSSVAATTTATERKAAAASAAPLPSPIAQVDLSTATSSASWLAVTFTMPAGVPPGSYPATVTTTIDLGDGQTYTTTTNYTLTVASNGTAALSGLNVTLGQYSSGLLTIYPAGTTLPTPTASPTPAPSMTPTAAPTATATPTAGPTATPTAAPTPTAVPTAAVDCLNVNAVTACGSYVANGSYDGPAGYYSPAPTPGVTSPQPLYNHSIQGDLEGSVTIPYYWFVGTVTITLDNYAPGQQQTPTNDCPATFSLAQSGLLGDTYTLTFPANGAQSAIASPCTINVGVPNEMAAGGAYNLNIQYPEPPAGGAYNLNIHSPGGAILQSGRRGGGASSRE